jgi:hypothetical protein
MAQKYDNGASLFLIQYDKKKIVKARVIVYDVEKQLYKIAVMADGSEITRDVQESDLITYAEVTRPENAVNTGLPDGYKEKNPGPLYFAAGEQLYVGTVNSLDQWQDYGSNSFIQDVVYWMSAR